MEKYNKEYKKTMSMEDFVKQAGIVDLIHSQDEPTVEELFNFT